MYRLHIFVLLFVHMDNLVILNYQFTMLHSDFTTFLSFIANKHHCCSYRARSVLVIV